MCLLFQLNLACVQTSRISACNEGNRRRLHAGKLNLPRKKKKQTKNKKHLPLEDSIPAQRNEEEVQENKSSRHNSVTAAVSNGQTTSQALTLTLTPSPDRSRKQATSLSRVPVHCITPFCSERSFHRPTFIRPAPPLSSLVQRAPRPQS